MALRRVLAFSRLRASQPLSFTRYNTTSMEPVWSMETNTITGLQCWSRQDKEPNQKTVRFKCDVEVCEYLQQKEEPEHSSLDNEKEPSARLLVASLAVVVFTFTYKWWLTMG